MLAFFGLILAALLGVTALALDLGVAGLAHARLETAAEFVALESARGASEDELREQASALLAEGPGPDTRVRLGPIGPLEAGDAGCAGGFPTTSAGVATMARRIPLLFGHGSMLAFASPTSWGQILAARNDLVDPKPTPVLPDAAIPPDTLALREQGLCVEGRGSASLVPALAVVADARFTIPGAATGTTLSIRRGGALWQSLAATSATRCLETEQGGAWFALSAAPTEACDGHAACIADLGIDGGSDVVVIGSELGGVQASLTLTDEPDPSEVDLHRAMIAPVRDAGDVVIGFATLCVRRVSTSHVVAMRWNDAATPFAASTSQLHGSAVQALWPTLREYDEDCRHSDDEDLRCYAQSAVLSLPGGDA